MSWTGNVRPFSFPFTELIDKGRYGRNDGELVGDVGEEMNGEVVLVGGVPAEFTDWRARFPRPSALRASERKNIRVCTYMLSCRTSYAKSRHNFPSLLLHLWLIPLSVRDLNLDLDLDLCPQHQSRLESPPLEWLCRNMSCKSASPR